MNKRYIIAISFANYLKDKTGIPKVMMAHQQMYNENQISYVALFSVKKNVCNDRFMLFCKYGLIIDGEYRGIFQMSQLIHLFFEWQKDGKNLLDIHIHHLMYTNIDRISDLLEACSSAPIKVYLHDYYNACCGYTLLKNREAFCGGYGFAKERCNDCIFTEVNKRIQEKIHKLFRANFERIIFVSPSETTKNIFVKFHPEYAEKILVIPHQRYSERYKGNLDEIGKDEKIRVAFLGMPHKHKGWSVWTKLVDTASAENYEFMVFNSSDDTYPGMKKTQIGFSKENLNAMTDALREYKVHIAVLWSIWPETYSYTCFEAFSANAFIVTNTNSGNIADVVGENGNGIVLSNEDELHELFLDINRIKRMINTYRKITLGGPSQLYENYEIVDRTLQHDDFHEMRDSHRLADYPLLWILNKTYQR